MKVLVAGNYQKKLGGAHSAMINTAKLLANHQHDVRVFSYDIDVDEYYKIKFGKAYAVLKYLFFPILYIYNPFVVLRLQRLISDFRPDCINVHLYIGGLSNSIISVIKANSIPSLHTVHDYRGICPANAMLDNRGNICESCSKGLRFSLLKRCADGSFLKSLAIYLEALFRRRFFPQYKSFDRLIFVSDFCKQKHFSFEPRLESGAEVINNFSEIEIKGKTAAEKHVCEYDFIYIGRLSKEKGIAKLIQAVRDSNVRLAVAGNGPLRNVVEASALENDNIEYLGVLDIRQVSRYLSKSRFMVLPSQWYENNPLSIIEAFSLGVPCVGAKIGGIPELIEVGKTGLIFDPFDTDNIKKTLNNAMLIDSEEYKKYSDNCLEKYEKHLSKTAHIAKLESLINELR